LIVIISVCINYNVVVVDTRILQPYLDTMTLFYYISTTITCRCYISGLPMMCLVSLCCGLMLPSGSSSL